jgi:phosphate transport system substrate-binding protein
MQIKSIKINILSTSILVVILLLLSGPRISAQVHEKSFIIQTEKSLMPLAEGWIKQYGRINPGISIEVVEIVEGETSVGIRLFEHFPGEVSGLSAGEEIIHVGQTTILPVINANNPHFSRELRRGAGHDRIKDIFFNEEIDWLSEDVKTDDLEYAVYTPMPRSPVAKAFADFFGKLPDDLKGIYVSGEDAHLLSALINDPAGIGYSKLSLIYDPVTRQPVDGIRILPVDLNDNGRLDRNELIYDNLDQVIEYTGRAGEPSLPAIQISFVTRNNSGALIEHFIDWVKNDGQNVNIQLGYNSNGNSLQGEPAISMQQQFESENE